MRLSSLLLVNTPNKGRTPQPVNKVPFVEIMRMKLKERVSGKADKKKEGGCLYEFSMLINCLQENNYENRLCKKYVDSLQSCYKNYMNEQFQSKRAQEKGLLVPGEKNLTHKQVKKLFKMRPLV